MNIAIVHDYLTQRGGAERVVLRLAMLFPGAPVFTSIYRPEGTFPEFRDVDVRTSDLQGRVDPERFRRSAARYPGAFRRLKLAAYDTVLVSSSAFAHHVRHANGLVYCYTPPRFLYEPASYFGAAGAAALSPLLFPMRFLDRKAARRHRSYVGISRATAERIRRAYGLRADVVYPPLATGHLPETPEPLPTDPRALVISRLLPYKRVEVAIAACAHVGIPLTIVGEGPEEARLRELGGGTATFLGAVSDETLRELFRTHSLVLTPAREDFGYAPVEANYSGRPVVAFAAGGALETVRDGTTGRLVRSHDEHEWAAAVRAVLASHWSPSELRAATKPFHADVFDASVRAWLGAVT